MPRRVSLPPDIAGRPFHVLEGEAYGLTEGRMRSGDLTRPFRGVRLAGAQVSTTWERCLAYAARMLPDQAFSHTTAAILWGIPLPTAIEADGRIHVSAIGGTRPRMPGVVGHELHRNRARVVIRHGLPVTDAVTTCLHLASVLRFDDLIAAADHLVLTPRRTEAEDPRPYVVIEELIRRLRTHRGRGSRMAMIAAEWIRDGAESPRETALRLSLRRHGLPEPELNAEIRDARARFIAFGDVVYPQWKVLVEYDGEQHRTDSKQYHRDIERHDALIGDGWVHIRQTKETPLIGIRSVPARTEQSLRARGWARETSLSAPPGSFWRGK